jgi:hypothetical protein
MPGGDRTGPTGKGPLTGRGAGFCAGDDRPGYGPFRGFGRGFGRGGGGGWGFRGRGRGWWGYGPAVPPSPDEEAAALRTQAEGLQAALKNINDRLDRLENKE